MDPYAIITCLTQEKRSSVASGKGSTPEWNETFLFTISDDVSELRIKIMDSDYLTQDDFVGEATIPLESLFHEGSIPPTSYNVTKDEQYCGEIRVGLTFTRQFVYDRNQMNVLEVNKTDYENCISDHPLHNWTTGAGRDVVPLNVTRKYYFISGKGFCYGGMKLAVLVENPPPPPVAAPIKSGASTYTLRGQIVIPAVFAIAAVWDSFLRVW